MTEKKENAETAVPPSSKEDSKLEQLLPPPVSASESQMLIPPIPPPADSSEGAKKLETEFHDDTSHPKTRTITTTIRETGWRFAFLVTCCLSLIGNYFCYDNPAPVAGKLKGALKYYNSEYEEEHGMHMSDLEYNLLYSFYSFPNIILPLFGGYFIDKLGKRRGLVIFAIIITIGQFFFALSTHAVHGSEGFGKFLMIFGRLVFGLGGENMSVTESAFVASWFKGKELSLALGIDICVSRLATAINDVTQPEFYIANGNRLHLGFWFGFILCILSLGCAVLLIYIDIKADKSVVQLEVPILIETGNDTAPLDEEEEAEEEIKLSDYKHFSRAYWLLAGNCILIYMSFLSFMNVASDFLHERLSFSTAEAGIVLGLPYTLAALVTPFLGYMIDQIGMKPFFITGASLLFTLGHFFLMLLPQTPSADNCYPIYRGTFAFVLFGFAFSAYTTSLWPCIPYVVEKRLMGSAYGIITAIENVGLSIGPLLVSLFHSSTSYKSGYFAVSFMNFIEALAGTCFGAYLAYYDYTHNQILMANSELAVEIQRVEKIRQKKKKAEPPKPTVPAQISI